jgi:hypothetical protein
VCTEQDAMIAAPSPTGYAMKYRVCLLTLFSTMTVLSLAGCGNPPTPPAPRAKIFSQKEIDETHAKNFLEVALDFEKDGEIEYAIDTLKELVAKFPETETAEAARTKLEELEASNDPA